MSGVVIDSSAIVALVLAEPIADAITTHIEDAEHRVLSAATYVELSIVIESLRGLAGLTLVADILRDSEIEIVACDEDSARRSIKAWRRFGREKHSARLNFGDCFTYALADETGYPVLCTGNDFAQTDLEVLPPR